MEAGRGLTGGSNPTAKSSRAAAARSGNAEPKVLGRPALRGLYSLRDVKQAGSPGFAARKPPKYKGWKTIYQVKTR